MVITRLRPNPSSDRSPCECIWLIITQFLMQLSVNRYTCKWAVPTGGGTLGSKGIRANGGRAAGAGPLITGKGGVTGVLSNGCLLGNAPASGGTAAGNRGTDCCAIRLLHRESHKQNSQEDSIHSTPQPHPTFTSVYETPA